MEWQRLARKRYSDEDAPNAGARSECIVAAWDCPQNGVEHFEKAHNIKTNNETGLVDNTPVVRVAWKPASKTNR